MRYTPSLPKKLAVNQIVDILIAHRDGARVQALADRFSVPRGAIYWWTTRYEGLDATGFRRVRELEDELRRLRSDMARSDEQASIGTEIIKQLEPSPRRRSWLSPPLQAKFGVSRKLANRVLGICEVATGSRPRPPPTSHLIEMMKHYLAQNPGHGLATMYQAVLRGTPGGIARARKAYHEAGLSVKQRTKTKAKLPARVLRPMEIQGAPNRLWSMDFMLHGLMDGTRFRILNVIDDFNREAIVSKAMPSNTTIDVVEALNQVARGGRVPECIRTDNGPEFKSLVYLAWTEKYSVRREYTRPYHCTDNAYIESFNRILRKEVLHCYKFDDLAVAQRMLDDWRMRYNLSRPHFRLGGLSPIQYAHVAALGRAPKTDARYSQTSPDFEEAPGLPKEAFPPERGVGIVSVEPFAPTSSEG